MIPVVLLPLSVHGGCSRYHWIVVAKFTDCWLEQAEKARGKGRKKIVKNAEYVQAGLSSMQGQSES